MSTRGKFQVIAKKRSATKRERKITEDMENDAEKYFNDEGNLCANQQEIWIREMLRGLTEKEWVSLPHESTDCG